MDERLEYIHRIRTYPEDNLFILTGMNYDGMWYIGGRLKDGKIVGGDFWSLENERFDFGNLGKFYFTNSTVREVRRRDIIEAYEKKHYKDSAPHIEDLIGMPWEKIWSIVSLRWNNQHLKKVA